MSNSSISIYIADSDPRNAHLLQKYLQAEGFSAKVMKDRQELTDSLQQSPPSLLVLDRNFSPDGGPVVCQALRQEGYHLPVLMLLSKGDDTRSFVNAKVGANACLRKTHSPLRLLTKVQMLLSLAGLSAPHATSQDQHVVFGPFVFDVANCSLRKAGEDVPLTAGDCSMLRALTLRPHQALGREELSLLARGRLYEPFDRSLDVQVSRLRKLIEVDNRSPRYLQTVWGSGYVFVPEGKRQTDKIVKPEA